MFAYVGSYTTVAFHVNTATGLLSPTGQVIHTVNPSSIVFR